MTLERLDNALDDLPRYFAITNQTPDGWLPWEGESPEWLMCVSVDDVREMLRRQTSEESHAK